MPVFVTDTAAQIIVARIAARAVPVVVPVWHPDTGPGRYRAMIVNTPVCTEATGRALMAKAAHDIDFALMWTYTPYNPTDPRTSPEGHTTVELRTDRRVDLARVVAGIGSAVDAVVTDQTATFTLRGCAIRTLFEDGSTPRAAELGHIAF